MKDRKVLTIMFALRALQVVSSSWTNLEWQRWTVFNPKLGSVPTNEEIEQLCQDLNFGHLELQEATE